LVAFHASLKPQLNQERFTSWMAPVDIEITPLLIKTLQSVTSIFLPNRQHPPPVILDRQRMQLLHGTSTCDGVAVHIAASPSWNSEKESSKTLGILTSIENACILVHQDLTAENRPWLNEDMSVATRVDCSLLGLAVQVEHKGKMVVSITFNFCLNGAYMYVSCA